MCFCLYYSTVRLVQTRMDLVSKLFCFQLSFKGIICVCCFRSACFLNMSWNNLENFSTQCGVKMTQSPPLYRFRILMVYSQKAGLKILVDCEIFLNLSTTKLNLAETEKFIAYWFPQKKLQFITFCIKYICTVRICVHKKFPQNKYGNISKCVLITTNNDFK